MPLTDSSSKKVVILGAGFGGLELAKRLRNSPYDVVLVDRNNYFTFQPLLYQVATGGLEPNSITFPLRRLFRRASNVRILMAEVLRIDPEACLVETNRGTLTYQQLVIATGSQNQFFGLDREKLLPLKTAPEALAMRNHVLREFERAAAQLNGENSAGRLNFVVVGGGPTGVELAGALGEMKKFVFPKDYPELDLDQMNIYLVEGLDRLLPAMSEEASAAAKDQLEELDVQIHLHTLIKEYDGRTIYIDDQPLLTKNLIWTAGVKAAAPEGAARAERSKDGRLRVDSFNRVPPYENIYAVGDVAAMISEEHPQGYPMLAPVAIQQGSHLAANLVRSTQNQEMRPFHYQDRGTMATIGRNRAVADVGKWRLRGFIAWLAWMFVHLLYLVGFRNKAVVLLNWIYNYFTYDKALRLIIEKEPEKTPNLENRVEHIV